MKLKLTEFSGYLNKFEFRTLFNEMGWNNDTTKHSVIVDNITFNIEAVAEKSNFKILVCSPRTDGNIPEYSQRIKIDQEITKFFQEHLLIFADKKQTEQLWQLVVRQPSKPITVTTTRWNINQKIEILYQRFANVFFELDEEDNITIIDVKNRLLENFQVNNEKVTKKFYDRFKIEHDKFKNFIKGINDFADLEWYTSLMLNRLMFIYFIQKKGFLDGDFHYLQNRLKKIQTLKGKDQFHQTFYRYFLLKLFHDGLGKQERNNELEKLIGKIPYLNGGFFEVHEIESRNENIDINDEAFEKLFGFFDEYEWHLDMRHHATGKEINPDVVGYIFEKYINQKEKGAYYTKEDITEYISKNTIIPFLFDKSGVDENHLVWELLQNDPDRYIYEAVRKGVDIPLPSEIEIGIKDISQRTNWNKPASSDYSLPTETWREHVARRTRCLEIRNKIKSGQIKTVNDLITFNLDIRQLAQDLIFHTDNSKWLWEFYSALDSVTILDPTCGSGAFLFAAMNILEPLYEACLNRMENMIGIPEYAEVKRKIQSHPNRRYFIYKNIILNNLFGVDIMDEAVEICKLRLFLKLAAEVETSDKIEPLPDIDFNIRSGNTLVGYVSLEQIQTTQKNKLTFDDGLKKIEQSANNIDILFQKFRQEQTLDKTNFIPHLKQDLRNNLNKLRDQLDHYLANEYKIDTENSEQFSAWQKSHQPFHWIVEFYGILKNGGFDAVIGNPPYVEYSNVKKFYTIKNYETEKCGNLYGFVMERSDNISQTKTREGYIIPLSVVCTARMQTVQRLFKQSRLCVISNFSDSPGLFDGVDRTLSIVLYDRSATKSCSNIFMTNFYKWKSNQRKILIDSLSFYNIPAALITDSIIPKINSLLEINILIKIYKNSKVIGDYVKKNSNCKIFYRTTGGRHYKSFTNFRPTFILDGKQIASSRETFISFDNEDVCNALLAICNSNLYIWFYYLYTNCRDNNPSDVTRLSIDLTPDTIKKLSHLSKELMDDLIKHSTLEKSNNGKGQTQTFHYCLSKHIIDKIDRVLAQHYSFTEEELDFIINYDIKYRMNDKE
jgi:hypothetical protein